jgi:hypothetical protein
LRAALAALLLALAAQAAAASESCRTVHGRMDLWNGTPSVRIWVIGTHRVLGVEQRDEKLDDLPAEVRRIWSGKDPETDWRTSIYGDFTVCPVAAYQPGRMQHVRLAGAQHLSARPRP